MKRTQIPELTGLRGLAVLLILINHMMLVAPMLGPMGFARSTLLCGISGMSLFFILSGIVIYYNYASLLAEHPAEGTKRFLFARFLRWRALLFSGDISYSVYLLHIVFVVALYYDGSDRLSVAKTIVYFLVSTYVAAWLSCKYFESPARKFIRGFVK